MGGTEVGTILGTAAYMSPEQAKGRKADKRADNWSFGVVLWEMLTGQRLFGGESTVDILANVLNQPLDLNKIGPKFRPLLERCLHRTVKDRLRDIGEARFLLANNTHDAVVTRSAPSSRPGWIAAALATIALASTTYALWRPRFFHFLSFLARSRYLHLSSSVAFSRYLSWQLAQAVVMASATSRISS